MNKQTLYIMCGAPGSGKSTWIEKNIAAEGKGICVSRDGIRFSILKEDENYFAHEKEVFAIFTATIQNYLNAGKDVYADATHLNEKSRNKLLKALSLNKNISIVPVNMRTNLETCIERNNSREGIKRVPETVLTNMYNSFSPAEINFNKYAYIINVF